MNWHFAWMWLWFLAGTAVYIVKRAYYLIKGPNPVANTVDDFIAVAWVPLGFRTLVNSVIYWICFSPDLALTGLNYFGWAKAAFVITVVTKFAPVAFIFGLAIDPLTDWAIPTLVCKIPVFKDFWPQMPPPLRPETDVTKP